MADKKITQLDAVTSPANTDLLLIVRDPSTTPVNKKLEIGDMFGETSQTVFQTVDIKAKNDIKLAGDTVYISSNTSIVLNNPLKVNDDRIIISQSVAAPANSNNSYYAWETGTFAYNANYLYIAVSPSLIARFAANTSW